jgi:hypothetical protein
MTTSLKEKDANEIAEAMAKALGDDIFNTASVDKEAQSDAFNSFHGEIGDSREYDTLVMAYNKWGPGMSSAEKESAVNEVEKRSGRRPPGERVPPAADDQPVSDMVQDAKTCEQGCMCPKCASLVDDQTVVALDFAMGHLIKVADALDKKGFAGVAGMVDETIEKLAAKKDKKEKEEKEKKEKKEKKKEKKEKKEEKEKKAKKDKEKKDKEKKAKKDKKDKESKKKVK